MAARKSSCNCGQLSVSYDGPDPQRVSLCQCYECQKRTGSAFSWQARLPIEHVTIEGESTRRTVPDSGKPAEFRSCDSGGATFHFCGGVRFDRVLGDLGRTGPPRGRGRHLRRPDVSAANDCRLRGVRGCVGDERLGPSDAGRTL